MSRDKKIHNLIEQQDNKGKQENWAKIKNRLEEDENSDVENGNNTRAVIFSKKAILSSICAAALLIAAILLIVLVPRKSNSKDYLTSDYDYSIISTDYNIKDYAVQTGNDFLYFNWYDETEYCSNEVIKANKTTNIICYKETIMDMQTGYMITFYITDLKTNIDILVNYKECKNIETISGIKVKWIDNFSADLATFDYKGFRYYMEIKQCESPEILLGYIEQLLN